MYSLLNHKRVYNDFITNCNYDLNVKCNNEFITKGN